MANKNRVNTVGTSLSMSKEMFEKVEKECKALGMNRSAFIVLCINQYFKSTEALNAVDQLKSVMAQLQDLHDKDQFSLFNQAGGNQ